MVLHARYAVNGFSGNPRGLAFGVGPGDSPKMNDAAIDRHRNLLLCETDICTQAGLYAAADRFASRAVKIHSADPQPSPLLAMAFRVQAAALGALGRTDEAKFVEARAETLEAEIEAAYK